MVVDLVHRAHEKVHSSYYFIVEMENVDFHDGSKTYKAKQR